MLLFLSICKEKISIRIDLLQTGNEPIEKIPVCLNVFKRRATTRQSAERQTYIKKMNAKEKGYTQEGLLESEKDFGLFLLETNDLKKKPQEVFAITNHAGESKRFTTISTIHLILMPCTRKIFAAPRDSVSSSRYQG